MSKYLQWYSKKQICHVSGDSYYFFKTIIESQPSIENSKKILWEILEYFQFDQFIEKLSWYDFDSSCMPEMSIKIGISMEQLEKLMKIYSELKEMMNKAHKKV